MRKVFSIAIALMVLSLLAACTGRATPPVEQKKPVEAVPPSAPKASWEHKWENVMASAKKEGKVSLYTIWRPWTRDALGKAFWEKFGITLEFTPFGRGGEILVKVQAEKRAGLYLADAFGAGAPTLLTVMKPAEILGSIEPLLILTEVIDPNSWTMAWGGGQLPFMDKDKKVIGMIASIWRFLTYNTELVKEGEVVTYRDALKPQFKGKVTLNDPTITGPGNQFMTYLATGLWNQEEAIDFLKQLVRQQDVVIQRDNRLHIESVARGKFAIGLATVSDVLEEFLAVGSPIKPVIVREGTAVSPAAGGLAVPTSFAHPNAAQVFVNWILSKEGQEIFSRSFGSPGLRKDVTNEWVRPIFLPQPGEKLFWENEERVFFTSKMQELARKAIDEARR